MATNLLRNPHPGVILKEEFLDELHISQNALAKAIGVPQNRINEIIRGIRGITADTDLRLCRYFGQSEGFWLRIQNSYDLREAHRAIDQNIREIVPFRLTA
ncbi:MAG: HigA family addiction module antidote protein [Acidobacteriaceae bacterium]|nr:HigA family addiction module antidote protein [Acidobacteriaceae bacterium]MBV9223651.1 HigA family addiction module antidote protein [Acidobacteriaceae bacterium]MBV9676582.1 HigA family addiction module antidote protein [Acidobacteriaceae bacterium]